MYYIFVERNTQNYFLDVLEKVTKSYEYVQLKLKFHNKKYVEFTSAFWYKSMKIMMCSTPKNSNTYNRKITK